MAKTSSQRLRNKLVRMIGLVLLAGCGEPQPSEDSQTHWLRECSMTAECGPGLECWCGLCVSACPDSLTCNVPGVATRCFGMETAAVQAVCDQLAPRALCLAECTAGTACPSGQECVAGACVPKQPGGGNSALGGAAGASPTAGGTLAQSSGGTAGLVRAEGGTHYDGSASQGGAETEARGGGLTDAGGAGTPAMRGSSAGGPMERSTSGGAATGGGVTMGGHAQGGSTIGAGGTAASSGGTAASAGVPQGSSIAGNTPAGGGSGPTGGNAQGGWTAAAGSGSAGRANGSGRECERDADCTILADCCSCQAVPNGTLSTCTLACASDRCAALESPPQARCVFGQCVLNLTCAANVACPALLPACGTGTIRVRTSQGDCNGPCVPATECPNVYGCEACNAPAQMCVFEHGVAGIAHCVTVPEPCGNQPSCSCAKELCGSIEPCQDITNGIQCG